MVLIMSATASFYQKNALQLAEQYNSLEFEIVHQAWSVYWPESGTSVLDVGAGSGRDVRWFFNRGCSVVAVEPAAGFRHIGKENSSDDIVWLDDALPNLPQVQRFKQRFDLIILSAVWMHLPINQRADAIKVLSALLSDSGTLVVTLRHGEFKDSRESFAVSVSELEQLGANAGLAVCHLASGADSLNREEVTWQTVVMKAESSVGS